MWHFANINQEQKLERRQLLDTYATVAQLSSLVPILLLQCYFLVCWVQMKITRTSDAEIPGSPYRKRARSTTAWWRFAGASKAWKNGAWWMGGRVEVWGFEATKGEILMAGVWTVWLLVLSAVQTNGDYLHLTKRFGIIGASQLPLHYLLAFKTPYSPLQLLTRCSWETLNNTHQLLGRIVTILFYFHTAFYLNFFVQANVLGKRIKEQDVILGLIATAAFTAVGTTALSWIRKRNYRIFYGVHVILATILLPVLYFHVHHIRLYIWETLAVYVAHFVLRAFSERTVAASVTLVPGTTDLLDIRIPMAGKKALRSWQPGQHVYLASQRAGLWTRPLRTKNPFTIASLPAEDGALRLIARVMDGNTAALAAEAKLGGNGDGKNGTISLIVEGPYGLTTHSETLLGYSRVLFIAGGVGATFVVPLYRSLLRDLSPSAGSRRRQNVKFVWAVRDAAEAEWAIPEDEREAKGVKERMSVFVTRGTSAAAVEGEYDDEGMHMKSEASGEENGVELERLLPSGDDDTDACDEKGLSIKYGRPDIRALVDETFAGTGEKDKVAVIVCGPKGLARNVRKEVAAWTEKREVWLWSEEFGL